MKSVFKKYICTSDVAQKSAQVPCKCILRRLMGLRGFDLFLNIGILNDLNNRKIYFKNVTKTACMGGGKSLNHSVNWFVWTNERGGSAVIMSENILKYSKIRPWCCSQTILVT